MNKSVAIYSRVSTDEQGKGYSLQTQLDGSREYIKNCGDIIVGEFADDYTGTKLDRPELDKIRNLARSGSINKVVVYELDRLARGMVKQILIEEEFAKLGVAVEYVLAEYGDNPEGRLQKNVRAVIAEYEREKFIERSKRGKHGRAKAGNVNPGRVSKYGYTYVSDPEGHKGAYVINEEEARVVRLIYTWYVVGDETGKKLGMNKIAKRLSEMRIPTRYDKVSMEGKRSAKKRSIGLWAESSIREILCSEIYAGTHYYNQLNIRRAAGEPRVRERSEWIPINVPAIVSKDLWDKAQQMREGNKKRALRNTQHPYLMRGRLRCTRCGFILGCRTDTYSNPPRGHYICNRGKTHYYQDDLKTPLCRGSIRSDILDEIVWDKIKSLLKSPQVIIDTLQQEAKERESTITIIRDRLQIAETQLIGLNGQRTRLLDLYLNGEFPKDILDGKMVEITGMIAKFEVEAASLQKQLETSVPSSTQIEDIERFCDQIQTGIENFSAEDRQTVIELLNVTAMLTKNDDELTLVLSGYFPDVTTDTFDLKSPSCSALLRAHRIFYAYSVKAVLSSPIRQNGMN